MVTKEITYKVDLPNLKGTLTLSEAAGLAEDLLGLLDGEDDEQKDNVETETAVEN
jgi:hypothetical protein